MDGKGQGIQLVPKTPSQSWYLYNDDDDDDDDDDSTMSTHTWFYISSPGGQHGFIWTDRCAHPWSHLSQATGTKT